MPQLSPNAIGIMAALLRANCDGIKEAVNVAIEIEKAIFRVTPPADMAAPAMSCEDLAEDQAYRREGVPNQVNAKLYDAEQAAQAPEADRTVSLTFAEVEMLLRGLVAITGAVNPYRCAHGNPDWKSAWDKLYPLGAGV